MQDEEVKCLNEEEKEFTETLKALDLLTILINEDSRHYLESEKIRAILQVAFDKPHDYMADSEYYEMVQEFQDRWDYKGDEH